LLGEPNSTKFYRWFAWEAARWLKSCSFIRPHHHDRYLLHECKVIAKMVQGITTHLHVPKERRAALAKVHGAAYVASKLLQG
jgi:hypothetical protein